MLKAKCPNCGYKRPYEKYDCEWWKWKPNLTWPCKKCGIMLKDDLRRTCLLLPVWVAFMLFFEFWVKDWSIPVYCLLLPVGIFIIISLKRVKIVQSSDQNSDTDSRKSTA